MAGKRILDAARVFAASRNVANQHFKIRSDQLDTWSKTSTIAKAVKNQTDRVTLTAQAAAALAQRFNDERPSYATPHRHTQPDEHIPRQDSVNLDESGLSHREGLQQDHHYTRDEQNAKHQPILQEDVDLQQEASVSSPDKGRTLESGNASNGAAAASAAPNKTDPIPRHEATPEQDAMPDGINTDIFHSPRIAELLGNKRKDGRTEYEKRLKAARKTPIDQTQAKDQPTLHIEESEPNIPAGAVARDTGPIKSSTQTSGEMRDLAADLAKDAQVASPQPEVR